VKVLKLLLHVQVIVALVLQHVLHLIIGIVIPNLHVLVLAPNGVRALVGEVEVIVICQALLVPAQLAIQQIIGTVILKHHVLAQEQNGVEHIVCLHLRHALAHQPLILAVHHTHHIAILNQHVLLQEINGAVLIV